MHLGKKAHSDIDLLHEYSILDVVWALNSFDLAAWEAGSKLWFLSDKMKGILHCIDDDWMAKFGSANKDESHNQCLEHIRKGCMDFCSFQDKLSKLVGKSGILQEVM